MVVRVNPIEEKENRHTAAGKVVVIGAEVKPLFRPTIVDGGHPELRMRGVHPVERGAKIGMFLSIATMVSGQLRPIMSMLMSATICWIGTGGCEVKYSLPQRPFSSPLTVRKMIERLGRAPARLNASASSITPVVPEASSSAPLLMLSGCPGVIPM